jgi:hypothetical protein
MICFRYSYDLLALFLDKRLQVIIPSKLIVDLGLRPLLAPGRNMSLVSSRAFFTSALSSNGQSRLAVANGASPLQPLDRCITVIGILRAT